MSELLPDNFAGTSGKGNTFFCGKVHVHVSPNFSIPTTFNVDFQNVVFVFETKVIICVRHVTGNDKDYLRKTPRVVW